MIKDGPTNDELDSLVKMNGDLAALRERLEAAEAERVAALEKVVQSQADYGALRQQLATAEREKESNWILAERTRERAERVEAKLATVTRERDEAREKLSVARPEIAALREQIYRWYTRLADERKLTTAAEARVAEARRLAFEEAAKAIRTRILGVPSSAVVDLTLEAVAEEIAASVPPVDWRTVKHALVESDEDDLCRLCRGTPDDPIHRGPKALAASASPVVAPGPTREPWTGADRLPEVIKVVRAAIAEQQEKGAAPVVVACAVVSALAPLLDLGRLEPPAPAAPVAVPPLFCGGPCHRRRDCSQPCELENDGHNTQDCVCMEHCDVAAAVPGPGEAVSKQQFWMCECGEQNKRDNERCWSCNEGNPFSPAAPVSESVSPSGAATQEHGVRPGWAFVIDGFASREQALRAGTEIISTSAFRGIVRSFPASSAAPTPAPSVEPAACPSCRGRREVRDDIHEGGARWKPCPTCAPATPAEPVREVRPARGEFEFDPHSVLSTLATEETPESRAEWERRCHCGGGMKPHIRAGYSGCEMWNHHCDSCHEAKACTLAACAFAAAPPPALREASVDYFIGPEAYNATVGVFCAWLRSRGHGDIADALACTAPEVLAEFAHADRSSRGGAP